MTLGWASNQAENEANGNMPNVKTLCESKNTVPRRQDAHGVGEILGNHRFGKGINPENNYKNHRTQSKLSKGLVCTLL